MIKCPLPKPEAGTTPRNGIPRPRVDDTAFLTSLCYVPAGNPLSLLCPPQHTPLVLHRSGVTTCTTPFPRSLSSPGPPGSPRQPCHDSPPRSGVVEHTRHSHAHPPNRLHHRHAGEIEFGVAGPTLPGHRRRGAEQMSWMPAPLRATLVARGGTASPAALLPCTRGQEGRGGAWRSGEGALMGMSSTRATADSMKSGMHVGRFSLAACYLGTPTIVRRRPDYALGFVGTALLVA